jgi:hypothetical protein
MRQFLPFLFFLLFGMFVAAMIVIYATLASKLHRLAPQGVSRFRCALLIGASPLQPTMEGTKEFRERQMTYRLILFGMGFLLMPLVGGSMLVLSRILYR